MNLTLVPAPRPDKDELTHITVKAGFKECPTCAAKPGSPTLCESCLHNRHLISLLKLLVKKC